MSGRTQGELTAVECLGTRRWAERLGEITERDVQLSVENK